jgi:uncharacterized protein YndB with AHSA1/START domain
MASIRREILIDAPAETVWAALRDIGALHTRLVPGFVTDTRLEPGARIVTFGNGQVARELIVDVDDTEHRLVWAIVDEPFQHYSAAAQVFSEKPRQCCFVWIADLLPDELADHVEGMMEQGLATIKATMENDAATSKESSGSIAPELT